MGLAKTEFISDGISFVNSYFRHVVLINVNLVSLAKKGYIFPHMRKGANKCGHLNLVRGNLWSFLMSFVRFFNKIFNIFNTDTQSKCIYILFEADIQLKILYMP